MDDDCSGRPASDHRRARTRLLLRLLGQDLHCSRRHAPGQAQADRRPDPAPLQPRRARPQHPRQPPQRSPQELRGRSRPRTPPGQGAMLFGALFNRGPTSSPSSSSCRASASRSSPTTRLMRERGRCLQALGLGRLVLHRSGEGHRRARASPSRPSIPSKISTRAAYVKIALTLRDIDRIARSHRRQLRQPPCFAGSVSPCRPSPAPPNKPKPCAP